MPTKRKVSKVAEKIIDRAREALGVLLPPTPQLRPIPVKVPTRPYSSRW